MNPDLSSLLDAAAGASVSSIVVESNLNAPLAVDPFQKKTNGLSDAILGALKPRFKVELVGGATVEMAPYGEPDAGTRQMFQVGLLVAAVGLVWFVVRK